MRLFSVIQYTGLRSVNAYVFFQMTPCHGTHNCTFINKEVSTHRQFIVIGDRQVVKIGKDLKLTASTIAPSSILHGTSNNCIRMTWIMESLLTAEEAIASFNSGDGKLAYPSAKIAWADLI